MEATSQHQIGAVWVFFVVFCLHCSQVSSSVLLNKFLIEFWTLLTNSNFRGPPIARHYQFSFH